MLPFLRTLPLAFPFESYNIFHFYFPTESVRSSLFFGSYRILYEFPVVSHESACTYARPHSLSTRNHVSEKLFVIFRVVNVYARVSSHSFDSVEKSHETAAFFLIVQIEMECVCVCVVWQSTQIVLLCHLHIANGLACNAKRNVLAPKEENVLLKKIPCVCGKLRRSKMNVCSWENI